MLDSAVASKASLRTRVRLWSSLPRLSQAAPRVGRTVVGGGEILCAFALSGAPARSSWIRDFISLDSRDVIRLGYRRPIRAYLLGSAVV